MANNTFVGFPHAGHSPPNTPFDADQVQEIQPITTWSRDGGYTVTRRWRGPIESLEIFSDGGAGSFDYAGTYFTGATAWHAGGPGMDGAISTDLQRDEGGQLGVFSATWVTSSLSSALGNPRASGRTGTSGDLYQESSLWNLDGNDIEKDLFDCPLLEACAAVLGADGYGFAARCKKAIENYKNGLDDKGAALSDPMSTSFLWISYLSSATSTALADASSAPDILGISGHTSLFDDLSSLAEDALKGAESYRISQYVLRNTKIVTYQSSQIPFYANTNRVWTTAQIKTVMAAETRTIDPPSVEADYTLPLIGLLGTVLDSSKWLYSTPDVTQLNNGKWQITKEWVEGSEIATSCYRAAV